MRKISPAGVKDDYQKQLADLVGFHRVAYASFASDKDHSTLLEHSLLAAAVIWEGFISDLFVAYINRNASRFKEHLTNSFEEHLKAAPTSQRVFAEFGNLKFPDHLSKSQVLTLADSFGNNITFSNFKQLEGKAKACLVPAHAARFTGITAQQKAVVNSLIALRNHIAHRSQRSLNAMNDVLAKQALHPTGLKRGNNRFHNVGVWLKAKPVGNPNTRWSIVVANLEQIGAAL